MNIAVYIVVAAVAYLLGSIPFGYILVRLFHGADVRQTGSGNIGATNVARQSPALGIATLVLDALKGLIAVFVTSALARDGIFGGQFFAERFEPFVWEFRMLSGQGRLLITVAALFAILGHMYPVWLRFKGGKGVATGVGAFLGVAPAAVGIVLVIFAVVVAVSRYVSLGSILATAAFPIAAYLIYRNYPLSAYGVIAGAALLIIYKHKDNIRRLTAGTEPRLGAKTR